MAQRIMSYMTLGELSSWLGNRRHKARIQRLQDFYYEPSGQREICSQGGRPGYFIGRSWVNLQEGDILEFFDRKDNIDVEIV